jgi:acetate---CoA ligase (ADP-forming)
MTLPSGLDLELAKKKVAALTAPRNVVLVGASDRPGSWAARVWHNLNRYEFPGPIHLINPRRTEIWDRPCYPDFAALPQPPDHIVVLVPAAGVIDTLARGAAAGARSATVFSAGFGEGFDANAVALGRALAAVIADTGLAVSGPNCMGNVCARSRLVTLTEDRPLAVQPGPVALVGQSGGMMIFTNQALQERGIWPEYLITSGNEAGLTTADYIAFFADQPELKVVIIYVEAIAQLEKFKAACRMARTAGKSVVAVKLGQSEGGRSAAMAHTGSLAGSVEAFDAVAGEAGVVRADTLDDAVEITELLVHTGAPPGRRLGAVTLSGAYRGLLLDSAERNGLEFPALAPATTERLNAVLTVGSLVSNPIDGGFGVLSSADNFMASIDALHADPNVDMVLVQEGLPRAPGSDRAEHYIRLADDYAATRASKPIAFISPISHGQTEYSRALRAKATHVSFLQEAYKALRAIASIARRDERERLARACASDVEPPSPERRALIQRLQARATREPVALDEVESKDVLRAYGIDAPAQELVSSRAAAIEAAARIGYPVVLKGVSATLLHKSDAGAVALDLATPEQLAAAYDRMTQKLAGQSIAGLLVCRQIRGGVELVLGLHRDPEMGLVVMAGSGGVLLELIKDVTFCAPPVSADKARDMLARIRGAKLLAGYRGSAALDIDAVINALIALGRLAVDLEDIVTSVDINPFVPLPRGGLALDALVVLQQRG